MQIGIITYHRSYNYGSALQAYALCSFLTKINHHVEMIDYKTERQQDLYRIYSNKKNLMSLARNFQSFFYHKKLITHKKRFDEFIEELIPVTKKQYCTETELRKENWSYDCFICGSDQIWNPNCIDFDTSYLLDFVADKSKCISYAPSIASNLDEKWYKIFQNELVNYRKLSVREKSGAGIISKITNRDVETVLDPVFLLSREEWMQFVHEGETDYILCYFIGDIPGMRECAKELGKKYKKKLVVINKNLRDWLIPCEKNYDCGPKEFVSLIYNASVICTNSFHAVSFSLIFNKEFYVFVDQGAKSAKSRILDLFEELNLSPGALNCEDSVIHGLAENLGGNKLNEMIENSKEYLSYSLDLIDRDIVR